MGSRSDYAVMQRAVEMLREFGVAHEVRVVSAHRTPELLFEYAGAAAGARAARDYRRVQAARRICRE